ncbi:hypothetical protein BN938_0431 [Mucinivorans hirudinis]|uniref:Uncharacterized protein n=1 Tax=Mucinivorans hirudinis TaxID=1433126 RepID=A0A060R691_9BACT|nr:hypothetical protein BN938_0431 [Mucinivorans hirudinis]
MVNKTFRDDKFYYFGSTGFRVKKVALYHFAKTTLVVIAAKAAIFSVISC